MIRNFGKKYKYIKILIDNPTFTKWTANLIYDVETNKVVIRTNDGKDYWIPLQDYICIKTWPLARTGRWPDPLQNATEIFKEELKEIEENTVEE